MTEIFNINDLGVIITGGSGILGGAMARHLAAAGAHVSIFDRNADAGEKLCQSIREQGNNALFVTADVLDKDNLEKALQAALGNMPRVNALINAAGGNHPQATCSPPKEFFDLPQDALQHVFNLNIMGTILSSQVVGKHFARENDGVILNISSMAADRPLTNVIGYSAAKAAIDNFTRWLATYMATRHNPRIRVNAIAPGFFLTDQNRFLLTDEKTSDLTARGRQIIQQTPMQRFGDPDELLGAVHYLLSPASRFVTGTVLPIDGGFSGFSI